MRKLLFVTPALMVLGLFAACSNTALVPAGGDCFQAIDCEPGLVCVPSGGKRICTSDLNGIVSLPPEAGGGDAAPPGDGGDATITYDGAADAPPPPPKDTGVPDNNPPPQDSGGNDAAPPVDSGSGG